MYWVYLIAGEDDYLRENSINEVKNKIFSHSSKFKDTNYKVFYAAESSPQEIIDNVRSIGFFNQQNLILVREFDKFLDKDRALIFNYAKVPSKKSILILETSDKRLLKDETFKRLSSKIKSINCQHPPMFKVPKYIKDFALLRKKRISKKAIDALIINLGNNLKNLDEAIERASLYVGKEDIRYKDVETLVSADIDYKIFNLTDALGGKNKEGALRIVKQLAVNKRSSLKLLGGINRYLGNIYTAKRSLLEGQSRQKIATNLGIYNFLIDKFFKHVNNFNLKNLEEGFRHILKADMTLKTKKVNPRTIIESLIIQLCS